MQSSKSLVFFTLILMISFASVNAVLFTPALPQLAEFFSIPNEKAQLTISWFLIGYTFGQLLYGPLANRYGRKSALYMGISLQIIASLSCILSGWVHSYLLLVFSRFMVALGSGVGLKMTFTLVNEWESPKEASAKISYLMLAFAITPGLSVALGGFLNHHLGWTSCFAAGAIYGIFLLMLVKKLPYLPFKPDYDALKWAYLKNAYLLQLKNKTLIRGALLMGLSTSFVYVFATLTPFIAINIMGMSSEQYGTANIIPSIGLVIGSLCSAKFIQKYSLAFLIKMGLMITLTGTLCMSVAVALSLSGLFSLFVPMAIIYLGLSFVLANASTLAMSFVKDKANGSAIMSFLNMGLATVIVLSLQYFSIKAILLPFIYLILCGASIPLYLEIKKK